MKSSTCVGLTLACATSLTLIACVPSIRPSAPNLPVAPVGKPPPSTIEVSIAVPLKAPFAAAEADIPSSLDAREYTEFFGTGGPDRPSCGIGCGYEMNRSALSFDPQRNDVTTSFSLSYWLTCRQRVPCRGRLVSGSCGKSEPRRRVTGSLTTQITVLPTWTATAITRNNGAVAQDQCTLGRLGKVNLTDKLAAGFSTPLRAILDAKLDQALSGLRPKAESAWKLLTNPIQIDADAWLEVKPQQMSISASQVSADALQLAIGLTAHPTVNIGGRPPAATNALPDATLSAMPRGTFDVYVPVKADYSAVEAALKQRLKIGTGDLRYPAKGRHYLTISDLTLSAYGQKAVFRMTFTGIAEGYAYLVGTPLFDINTSSLSFPDLDYSPDSRTLALESIQWVDQDAFIRYLRSRLVVDLTDPLNRAKSKLSDALNRQYGDVQLAGSIPNLALVSVYADPPQRQFVAYFDMSGAVSATVGAATDHPNK